MPRITPIRTKDQVKPEHHPQFDAIASSRGEVRGPFAMLMHSPELAGRAAHLGAYVRFEGVLAHRTIELAVVSAARALNCPYEWGAHVIQAKEQGISDTAIDAIRSGRNDQLPAEDRAVADFAQALVRQQGRVDEAAVKAMEARFGTQGVVELVATVGYYGMIGTVLNAFAVEPGAGHDVLPV